MRDAKKLEKYFKAISDSVMYAREKVRGWVNSGYKDSVQADNVLAAMSDVRVNANAVTKGMERAIKMHEDSKEGNGVGMRRLIENLKKIADSGIEEEAKKIHKNYAISALKEVRDRDIPAMILALKKDQVKEPLQEFQGVLGGLESALFAFKSVAKVGAASDAIARARKAVSDLEKSL